MDMSKIKIQNAVKKKCVVSFCSRFWLREYKISVGSEDVLYTSYKTNNTILFCSFNVETHLIACTLPVSRQITATKCKTHLKHIPLWENITLRE